MENETGKTEGLSKEERERLGDDLILAQARDAKWLGVEVPDLVKLLTISDAYDAQEQENERLRGQIHEADALLESTRSMTAGASTYQAVDLVVALDKVIQQAREALAGEGE